MFDFTGKVVVISGASSGLGAQMARGFAKQGATLVITARRFEKLQALADEFKTMGVECLPLKCDVTDSAMVDDVAKQVEEKFGRVDVTIATDMSSVFYVTRAFANIMKKNNYGRIINIASMYGLVGNTAMDTVAYHTSKGGVVNFTRAVAAELAKYNITCNAICPGYFATELTEETLKTDEFTAYMKATVPMGRYGKSGELNAGAIFLGSEEASYVTGVILPIDGGYTAV